MRDNPGRLGLIAALLWLAALRPAVAAALTSAPFGTLADGTPILGYTLTAKDGVSPTHPTRPPAAAVGSTSGSGRSSRAPMRAPASALA